MQYHTIASYQDYLDLCDYIEQDNPSIVEIGENYFVTEDRHYLLEYDVKGILQDVNTYVFGEVMNTAPDKILNQVKNDNISSLERIKMLFGKDNRKGIVNFGIKDDNLHIFYLDGREEIVPCEYWVLAEKNLDGKMERLEGDCSYKFIKKFKTEEKLKLFKKKHYSSIYTITDLIEQQLTIKGITLYKDVQFEELNCLAFDIETNGTLINKNSKVFVITNTHYTNDKIEITQFVLDEYPSAKAMIEDWCEYIYEINPSILTGHNIIGFDIPFLKNFAEINGTSLTLGRDRSDLTIASRAKNYRVDGTQTWEYKDISIFGRDVIDGMFLAVKYDVARNFPSWGLKSIIEYLGLVEDGRQFYDASLIAKNWDIPEEREKIIDYCKDDGNDSKAIFRLMGASYFYMARSIPRTFQSIINTATGGWLNSIMVRAYLQDNHSIAKTDESSKVTGGISFGIPGVHKNCLKIDISSLYPSIMRQWHINNPKKDPKDVFFNMVDYNTTERLKNKKLAKETKEKHYTDLEQSQKVFINSAYGLLGTGRVNYNNFSDADFITSIGRRILSLTMYWATGKDVNYWFQPELTKGKEGYQNTEHDKQFEEYLTLGECIPHDFLIVNGDTDSITFKKKDESKFTEEEIDNLISEINGLFPEMINYENDGYFPIMVVTKAKNYVLYDGKKIKYKGSSFKDAKKEPKMKQLMKDIIENGLIYEKEDWVDIFNRYLDEAKDIKDIKQWATKKNITETLFESERLNETKVLDAIDGLDVKIGDKVFLYNAIDGEVQDGWSKLKKADYEKQGLIKNHKLETCQHTDKSYCYECNPHLCSPKMVPNKVLKPVEQFDGKYDVDHYLNRCYNTLEILSNVLDMERLK